MAPVVFNKKYMLTASMIMHCYTSYIVGESVTRHLLQHEGGFLPLQIKLFQWEESKERTTKKSWTVDVLIVDPHLFWTEFTESTSNACELGQISCKIFVMDRKTHPNYCWSLGVDHWRLQYGRRIRSTITKTKERRFICSRKSIPTDDCWSIKGACWPFWTEPFPCLIMLYTLVVAHQQNSFCCHMFQNSVGTFLDCSGIHVISQISCTTSIMPCPSQSKSVSTKDSAGNYSQGQMKRRYDHLADLIIFICILWPQVCARVTWKVTENEICQVINTGVMIFTDGFIEFVVNIQVPCTYWLLKEEKRFQLLDWF